MTTRYTIRIAHQDGITSRSDHDGVTLEQAIEAAWELARGYHLQGLLPPPVEYVSAREHRGWDT